MNYPNYQTSYQQAYQPNFQQNYQPSLQPYYQQIQQLQSQVQNQQANQNGGMFYFVNSQKEVEDWIVGAGQTVFFFDRNNSVFYIKSVAQNGLSQPVEVYDYTQRASEASRIEVENDMGKYITRDEFEALKGEIEALKEAEG